MKKLKLAIVLIVTIFTLAYCQREDGNSNPRIKFLKTEPGGCNNNISSSNIEDKAMNDTTIISFSSDTLNIYTGLNYICCAPFISDCSINNDSIIITIRDTCSTPYQNCYCRCSCYYTFKTIFSNYNQKSYSYKIELFDPREGKPRIINSGTIQN